MENWRQYVSEINERVDWSLPPVQKAAAAMAIRMGPRTPGYLGSTMAEPTEEDDKWRAAYETVVVTHPELKKYSRKKAYKKRMQYEMRVGKLALMHDDRVKIIFDVLRHICELAAPWYMPCGIARTPR
tara:strand:- start:305 stop:688 length:384 start_codon:yes stop_codon:yes gene_type:complete